MKLQDYMMIRSVTANHHIIPTPTVYKQDKIHSVSPIMSLNIKCSHPTGNWCNYIDCLPLVIVAHTAAGGGGGGPQVAIIDNIVLPSPGRRNSPKLW